MSGIAGGVALALASAVLHAIWNLRLKASDDPLRLAARGIPMATGLCTPFVAAAWLLTGRPILALEGWILAIGSGLVELAYFHLLSTAYRRAEISAVYPVARGTAPVLAVAVGVTLYGEQLTALQWTGVAALVAGVWLARPGVASRAALLPALATGVCIAGYTALDRLGVRTGPFWLYGWATFAAMSVFLLPWARERVAGAAGLGMLTVGAYSLVLLALSIAPMAVVAPVREAGVVIVAGWGVLRLGEREGGTRRLVGAVGIVAGALLLVI